MRDPVTSNKKLYCNRVWLVNRSKTVFNLTESKSKTPAKVRAKDCMERISKIFSVEDDFTDLLSTLAEKYYVLVSKRSKVTHIITSHDALMFFKTY